MREEGFTNLLTLFDLKFEAFKIHYSSRPYLFTGSYPQSLGRQETVCSFGFHSTNTNPGGELRDTNHTRDVVSINIIHGTGQSVDMK